MKPYEQSQHQVSRMPQRDNRDRIVFIASLLVALFAVCIAAAEAIEPAATVQIASK